MTIIYTASEAAQRNIPVMDYSCLKYVVTGDERDQVNRIGNALEGSKDQSTIMIGSIYIYIVRTNNA
jgi:hypothetical protein